MDPHTCPIGAVHTEQLGKLEGRMTSLERSVTEACKAVDKHVTQDETRRTSLDGWSKVAIIIGPALAAAVMWWVTHLGATNAVAAVATK